MRRWPWYVLGFIAALAVLFWTARVSDTDQRAMVAKYGGPASSFVPVEPGLRVHVRDQGARGGPVLLLIHGSNASLHTWEPWVTRLRDRYRLVSLDLPGHGLTGAHPRRCYTADCMVAAVEAVRARLGLAGMAVAGNSMGGWVAWRYALAHPERTRALVLVNAAGAPPAPGAPEPDLPIGFRVAQSKLLRPVAEQVTPRWLVERSLKQTVADPAQVTSAMVDRYWELLRFPGNRQATIDRFSVPRTNTPPAVFAPLKDTPALILWGARDRLIPVQQADSFARVLPRSRTIIYGPLGHVPMEEAPARTADDVHRFLSGQGAFTGRAA